jgi:hypothetical protein
MKPLAGRTAGVTPRQPAAVVVAAVAAAVVAVVVLDGPVVK